MVIYTCHKIIRRFLWRGAENSNKIAWLNWETICKVKEDGGLGIKDLSSFNKALLGKWRWCFLKENDSLWHKVLCAKYCCNRASKASVWWQDLKNICFSEGDGLWFENQLLRKVGEGNETLFWSDDWLNGQRF